MKIGSCTVLYNPDNNVITNVETYRELFSARVIVDNSDIKNEISDYFRKNSNYIYIDMNGNKGIATALNKGADFLKSINCDYILTMDQDSQFPTSYYYQIIKLVNKYHNIYSIIGLNFNEKNDDTSDDIVEVPYWLTSGNFVNLADFFCFGKFEDDLFIDYVDIEYGYRLYKNKLKVCYLKGFSINHKIGNPIEINIFNKTYYAMNHSPIRYYYRYRNSYYLYLRDKKFFRKEFFKEIFVNIPKMVLFENKRMEKIVMIIKGLNDGKHKKLGAYNE